MSDEPKFELRSPSKAELAFIVPMLRNLRGWTQETLAELAGVSTRTIQRIEDGQGAGADTLRAIARAADAEDLDFLLRAQAFPTEAEFKKQQERFERENLMLDATAASTGRGVEAFMGGLNMLSCSDDAVRDPDVRGHAAALFDYMRDYLDVKGELSHQDRLTVADELEAILASLREAGWTPVVAVRHTQLTNDSWVDKTPWRVTIGYLSLAPKGHTPAKVAVPRRVKLE